MKDYEFTVKFAIDHQDRDLDLCIEKLYEAGCDDGLIGIGRKGYLALNFIREASSAWEAIASAIENIKQVMPTVILVEVTPDLVGLTDLAKLLGCSRQNMRNLILNDQENFPIPVYDSQMIIWHLADVLIWLQSSKSYQIEPALLEIAKVTRQLNVAREWHQNSNQGDLPNLNRDFIFGTKLVA